MNGLNGSYIVDLCNDQYEAAAGRFALMVNFNFAEDQAMPIPHGHENHVSFDHRTI